MGCTQIFLPGTLPSLTSHYGYARACYMIWSHRHLHLGPLWWILIKYCWEELGCHFDSCVCIYLCPLYYMDSWALVPLSEIQVHIFCATLHMDSTHLWYHHSSDLETFRVHIFCDNNKMACMLNFGWSESHKDVKIGSTCQNLDEIKITMM
jgi:hypothetical protein